MGKKRELRICNISEAAVVGEGYTLMNIDFLVSKMDGHKDRAFSTSALMTDVKQQDSVLMGFFITSQ